MWEILQNDKIINVHFSDLYLLLRALIFFALSLVAIRIMGKRTIAQLSPFDLITIIIIGAAVAIPMEDEKIPFVHGLIPLVSITVVNYLLHLLIMKNRKIENFLQGTPSVLVENGEVIVKNLRKERVTLADLEVLLREKNVRNINQVQEATLEPNGRLSIVLKEAEEPVTRRDLGLAPSGGLFPVLVIANGEVLYDHLAKSRLSIAQLVTEIQRRGIERLQDVARATLDERGNLLVVKREEKTRVSGEGQETMLRENNGLQVNCQELQKKYPVPLELFLEAVSMGLNDGEIAKVTGLRLEEVKELRGELGGIGSSLNLTHKKDICQARESRSPSAGKKDMQG